MGVVKIVNKTNGITYIYETSRVLDPETGKKKTQRTLIGKLDPEGKEIPVSKREKPAKKAEAPAEKQKKPQKQSGTVRTQKVMETEDAAAAEVKMLQELRESEAMLKELQETLQTLEKQKETMTKALMEIVNLLSSTMEPVE